MEQLFDVAIIGGGINGCGIAADAAMRGLSVILLEQDDLASKTSSSSTKLIHGGLRYLEQYDFALVKKALDERQLLLSLAPHLVYPLPFVLPYQKGMRPTWLLRAGLFIYDHLSRQNKLPRSQFIQSKKQANYFFPLTSSFDKGFLFYDCATDDARLTVSNALQAKAYGAQIETQSKVTQVRPQHQQWILTVQKKSKEEKHVRAQVLVNATGPWIAPLNQLIGTQDKQEMSLVKGSHLVVPKLYEGNHAYLLQHDDKRIVFVIPYQGCTLIGTTEMAFTGCLDTMYIATEEVTYLIDLVNHYFRQAIKPETIISSFSGVRPLLANRDTDMHALSRDYSFTFSKTPAPLLSVYGGKITTYRQLAFEAVNSLSACFPDLASSITHRMPLPGSTLGHWLYQDYVALAQAKYSWLETHMKARYLASYGTRCELLLKNCNKISDLGYHFGHGLYQQEVDYLRREEWVCTANDILWRRTKLGLQFNLEEKQVLEEYF